MNETSQNLRITIDTFTQTAQFDALIDTCKAALADARNRSDKSTEVIALMGLAIGHQFVGKFKDARILVNGALNLAEALQDGHLIARTALSSGDIYLKTEFKGYDAEQDFRRALKIANDLEHADLIAEALCGLAASYLQMDDSVRAQRYARQALNNARDASNRYHMGIALTILGSTATKAQPEKAMQAFEDAMAIAKQDNFRLMELRLIGQIGYLLSREERYADEGQLMLEKAYVMAQDFASVPDEFRAMNRLGRALEGQEALERAAQYYSTMLEQAQLWDAHAYEGIAFFNLGILAYNRKHYDDAILNFEQALTIARQTKNPFQEAQTEQVIGSCYLNQNQFEPALDHYMAARSIYDALDNDVMRNTMLQRIIVTYFQRLFIKVMRFLGVAPSNDSDMDISD